MFDNVHGPCSSAIGPVTQDESDVSESRLRIGQRNRRIREDDVGIGSRAEEQDINIRAMAPGPRLNPLNPTWIMHQPAIYRSPASLVIQSAHLGLATWAFGASAIPPIEIRKTPHGAGGRLLVAKNGLDAYRSRWTIALEFVHKSRDLVIVNCRRLPPRATTRTRISLQGAQLLSALP